MKNAWYIAATSEELVAGQLVAVTRLGQELVLFRDEQGTAHALRDQCPHRGARLSDGKHGGDHIACPFHGWRFTSDGRCRLVPANGPEAPIPKGADAACFPVCERAGFVWVWIGSEAPTEISLPPEPEDDDWAQVPFRCEWNAHLTRVVESILDISHLPFVHPEANGGELNPIVEGPAFDVLEREIVIRAKPYHPLVATPLNEEEASRGMSTITFTYPNQIILRTDMTQSDHIMATWLSFAPVDEERIILYGLALRNFMQDLDFVDEIHYEHNMTVLEQDRPIVEGLRPRVSPLDFNSEVHVRSDGPQVRYRLMLRKWMKES